MGSPNQYHDEIMSGLIVMPARARANDDAPLVPVVNSDDIGGTLSAIAKRRRDGVLVAVTCRHIVSGSISSDPTGGEEFYHERLLPGKKIGKVPPYDANVPAWKPVVSSPNTNKTDTAYAEIDQGVVANFNLHGHAGSSTIVHTPRRIESGAYTSLVDDELILLGRKHGERTVTVENTSFESQNGNTKFADVILGRITGRVFEMGESGAPVFKKTGDNQYQLTGIAFGSATRVDGEEVERGRFPIICKASTVQEELGIQFGNNPPNAVVNAVAVAHPGEEVELDGSQSHDLDGEPIGYRWEQLGVLESPNQPGVTILNHGKKKATFIAPNQGVSLSFQLTVNDRYGATDSATVSIDVVNTPPTAKPGINRVVPVHTPPSLTPAVTLLGAAEDPDTGHAEDMDYEWSVFSAPASTTGSSTRSASKAPSSRVILATFIENGVEVPNKRTFTPDAIGDYVFTLTVTDPGDLTHSANVTIHACSATGTSQWYETGETRVVDGVLEKKQTRWHNGAAKFQWVPPNHPPVAFAGYNDIVLPNTTVYLRGSSKDPDRHLATEMAYNWSLVEDVTETPGRSTTRVPQVTPLITIASPTSRRTSFTAPAQAQTLRIRLTVTDPNGATDTDDVITQVHSGVGTTEWLDTRATRGCGATRDKEQMRRIDRRPHGEYRWAADPEDEVWSAWEDTDQTRNRNEGDWTDTDPLETMGTPPDVEKKQTRTITWEQEQTRTSETCGTIEPQWLEASETETRWVPVTPPPPAGIPPKPTNDQWNVRRSTDGIYANVASLPTVSPAISEVQVRLQIDTTTVTATLGTTLDNSYAKVLADDSSNWQTGVWSVAIRFKNTNGYGPYSDAKIGVGSHLGAH